MPITVDAEAAHRFSEASPEERRKLELLLRLRLRELTLGRARPLQDIMDEVGRDAEAKGLTPAKLESMIDRFNVNTSGEVGIPSGTA